MISNSRTGSARWQVRRCDASALPVITSAAAEVAAVSFGSPTAVAQGCTGALCVPLN